MNEKGIALKSSKCMANDLTLFFPEDLLYLRFLSTFANIQTNKSDIMNIEWEDGYTINVTVEENTVVISANKEGLLSLAKQLADLADAETGSHIHYDKYNSLEENSSEMIIERIV